MLNIDYVVKTDEAVEVVSLHQPDNLSKIDRNIILIEGPESSGKSTLLNMIAVGCFGEDDDSLSESTRNNLKELSEDYRDVKFDFQISDPVSGAFLRLQKEKGKAPKVTETMDGRAISCREFRSKYRLVYDIPEDPTKRLSAMTQIIKNDNREIRDKIRNLQEIIVNYNEKLSDVPTEEEITKIKDELARAQQSLKNTQREYDELNKINDQCKIILNLNQLIEYNQLISKINDDIKAEEKKPASSSEHLKTVKEKWIKKYQMLDLEENSRQIIVDSRNDELIDLAKQINIMWRELDPYNLEQSTEFLTKYYEKIDCLKGKIPKDDSAISNTRIANELITLLNDFDPNASLGELGTVNSLKLYLQKYKDNLNAVDYNPVRNNIIIIQREIRSAEKLLNQPEDDKKKDNIFRDENKLKQWKKDREDTTDTIIELKEQLTDQGIYDLVHPVSTVQNLAYELFHNYDIDEITFKEKYEEWSSRLELLNNDREKDKSFSLEAEKKISRFEEAKTLPLYGKINEIQKVGDACTSLRASLNETDKRLEKIDRGDKTEYNQSPGLYEPIWSYLGDKLHTVRYNKVTYTVKSVDLLERKKGVITTVEGRKIYINAMGTGEGQQAYLKGLLSTDDSRKIIALFDEVGNMSGKVLNGVIEDLEKKQKEGKLMLGIVVQPRDDGKVTTYGL